MELKHTVQEIFSASPSLISPRVRKMKAVGGRFIVYVSSPTFDNPDSLVNQTLADNALLFNPAVSTDLRRQIGLIVPLSPQRYKALVRSSRERRTRKSKTAE